MSKALKPWRQDYLVFGAPYFGDEERQEMLDCIDSGWIGSGPRVARLEKMFCDYVGGGNAVALSSATAALTLSIKALNLPPDSEVIVPTMTFCATANAVANSGLTPVFVDCDESTMNISVESIEKNITSLTKAIIPVHFAGRPCEMDRILDLADSYSLSVIEDCAHSIESLYKGRHCGTMGTFGCFSFYVTKNMTTGEGGMLISGDKNYADLIRRLALHGLSENAWSRFSDRGFVHYDVQEPGFKYNLTDLAASLGIHQLERIEKAHKYREKLWHVYKANLSGLPIIVPKDPEPHTKHAYHLFTCLVDTKKSQMSRDKVLTSLHELRIGSGVHYRAVHTHPYYKKNFPLRKPCPVAEQISKTTFSIPLSYAVTTSDAADVVRALKLIFSG